jgi:pimeloyl-ACP methyl ester carboxylesterase
MSDVIRSGYVPVNGLQLYYEIHGAGEPLVLLHGGAGTVQSFGPNLRALATYRQVIGVELQAHGHTADIDRPLRYELLADDLAALIRYLNLGPLDVMGFSLGAGVALQCAIRHPGSLRRLIAISTPCRRDGWYPEILAAMHKMTGSAAEGMKASPLYARYARVAPRPQDWPVLFDKLHDLLVRENDWSKDIPALKLPVLLVFADADAMPPAHIAEFFGLLGGGLRDAGWDGAARPLAQLAIVPNTTHYTIDSCPALAAAVEPFLRARVS